MRDWFERFALWCPGALGLILRRKLYASRMKFCGEGLLIGRFVKFNNPGRIELGNRVVLHDGVVLDAKECQTSSTVIRVGDDVFIGADTLLQVTDQGRIDIESGTSCGSFCKLIADIPLTIGRDCLIAAYCYIGRMRTKEGHSLGNNGGSKFYTGKETVVGPGGWVGVRAHLKPGVKVGKGVVVGAHAIVDSDLPDYAIAYGRPAQERSNRATINKSCV